MPTTLAIIPALRNLILTYSNASLPLQQGNSSILFATVEPPGFLGLWTEEQDDSCQLCQLLCATLAKSFGTLRRVEEDPVW